MDGWKPIRPQKPRFARAALPLAGAALLVLPVSGSAAEPAAAPDPFEQAFAAFVIPDTQPLLSPAERLEAEALSAAAPRERKAAAPAGRRIRSGHASYYGARFAGRLTANGERFNPNRLTAAHRTLPFGSKVKVTNRRNGKSVVVRINDRGPYAKGRVIDLSKAAARRIGLVHQGHGPVELALLN